MPSVTQTINKVNVNRFDTPASRLLSQTEQDARRARMAQREQDAKRAMRLYTLDHAAARTRKGGYPKISDYVQDTWEDGPREQQATEYAKSRFSELPIEQPKRKRTVSPEAKARHVTRDRQRRREVA